MQAFDPAAEQNVFCVSGKCWYTRSGGSPFETALFLSSQGTDTASCTFAVRMPSGEYLFERPVLDADQMIQLCVKVLSHPLAAKHQALPDLRVIKGKKDFGKVARGIRALTDTAAGRYGPELPEGERNLFPRGPRCELRLGAVVLEFDGVKMFRFMLPVFSLQMMCEFAAYVLRDVMTREVDARYYVPWLQTRKLSAWSGSGLEPGQPENLAAVTTDVPAKPIEANAGPSTVTVSPSHQTAPAGAREQSMPAESTVPAGEIPEVTPELVAAEVGCLLGHIEKIQGGNYIKCGDQLTVLAAILRMTDLGLVQTGTRASPDTFVRRWRTEAEQKIAELRTRLTGEVAASKAAARAEVEGLFTAKFDELERREKALKAAQAKVEEDLKAIDEMMAEVDSKGEAAKAEMRLAVITELYGALLNTDTINKRVAEKEAAKAAATKPQEKPVAEVTQPPVPLEPKPPRAAPATVLTPTVVPAPVSEPPTQPQAPTTASNGARSGPRVTLVRRA